MARDIGWSTEWVFGALSAALLAGGLVAPWTGRWLDRFGAGRVMAAGSIVAAAALVRPPPSLRPPPAFVLALIAIEVASTFVQYGAAFPRWSSVTRDGTAEHPVPHPDRRVRLDAVLDPDDVAARTVPARLVYLVFAAMNVAVCCPFTCGSPIGRMPRRAGGRG